MGPGLGRNMKINRRDFLAGMGAAGATAVLTNHEKITNAARNLKPVFLPTILRASSGGSLNFITIMCDSLRYDHVGFLGNSWIQTPNIDGFAAQSQVFDHAYAGGYPTVLNRMELFLGRFMYPRYGWENMPSDTAVLAQLMNDLGYTTGIVFDTWHLKHAGFNFERGYQSWQWIRGQEGDLYRAAPRDLALPADPHKFRSADTVRQYLRNVQGRAGEADYFIAQTIETAVAWLQNHHAASPFYLHIDAFDPHEPWDPPQEYINLYNPGYQGQAVIYPAYAPPDYLSAAELAHMQALYAAEVSLVDTWLGILFAEIDALGLANNTIVILMADHGILLGEHNGVGKTWSHQGHFEAYPLYQELAHIPLMIRVPGLAPQRLTTLVQPPDVVATMLDMAGAPVPSYMHGRSLQPYMQGASGSPRAVTLSTPSMKQSLATKPRITVSDGEWTLLHGAGHASSELYYLPDDPGQQNNLLATNCDTAVALHQQMIDFLQSIDTPADRLAPWQIAPCP